MYPVYPVPARRVVFHNWDLSFTYGEYRLSGTSFSSSITEQNGCLHACAKLVNKVLHVRSWNKELYLHEETWLQQQESYSQNDEVVEYLLNSLTSYKATMGFLYNEVFQWFLNINWFWNISKFRKVSKI